MAVKITDGDIECHLKKLSKIDNSIKSYVKKFLEREYLESLEKHNKRLSDYYAKHVAVKSLESLYVYDYCAKHAVEKKTC